MCREVIRTRPFSQNFEDMLMSNYWLSVSQPTDKRHVPSVYSHSARIDITKRDRTANFSLNSYNICWTYKFNKFVMKSPPMEPIVYFSMLYCTLFGSRQRYMPYFALFNFLAQFPFTKSKLFISRNCGKCRSICRTLICSHNRYLYQMPRALETIETNLWQRIQDHSAISKCKQIEF